MQNESVSNIFQIVRAVLFAAVCAFLSTVLFAVVLNLTSLSDKIILPVNVVIRVISIFIGCLFTLRGEKGWLRGGAVGVLFTFVSGLLFAMLGGDFSLSWLLAVEVAFGFIVGALAGIFAVNFKQSF